MSDDRKDQLALFARSKERVARSSIPSETSGGAAVPSSAPEAKGSKERAEAQAPTIRVDPSESQPRRQRSSPALPTPTSGSIRARDTGDVFLFPQEKRGPRDMHFSRRLSDLVRRLQLLEREAKSEMGITLPQAHAIHALNDASSLRMQELAETLGLAQSTVTRLVAPLKRMGLLDRRPDRNDGRATRAFLTEKGTAAVDALETKERDLYTELVALLPETRRAEVVAAIELLHEAVRDITLD
jgi:DNA-binding MarR family transcriptional regulator